MNRNLTRLNFSTIKNENKTEEKRSLLHAQIRGYKDLVEVKFHLYYRKIPKTINKHKILYVKKEIPEQSNQDLQKHRVQ